MVPNSTCQWGLSDAAAQALDLSNGSDPASFILNVSVSAYNIVENSDGAGGHVWHDADAKTLIRSYVAALGGVVVAGSPVPMVYNQNEGEVIIALTDTVWADVSMNACDVSLCGKYAQAVGEAIVKFPH